MWKQRKTDGERILYVLEKGIYEKILMAQFISPYAYWSDPVPAKLTTEILEGDFKYRVGVNLYTEVDAVHLIKKEIETFKWRDRMEYNLNSNAKTIGELLSKRDDVVSDSLQTYMDKRIELKSSQKSRLDKRLPRINPENTALTREEIIAIKPQLVKLVSSLPELPEPFQDNAYYQEVIENFDWVRPSSKTNSQNWS